MDYLNRKVLFVDDEPAIVSAYRLALGKKFSFTTAFTPLEALEIIDNNAPFSVIVSDYNMPEMNGVEFLAKVQKKSPETVRILLTGNATLQAAIDGVNNGHIFRFLLKTNNVQLISQAIDDGIRQYHLITQEKLLLEKTLKGSIKLLIDVLSTVNPAAFSRSDRIRKIAKIIGERINIVDLWELEIAALLSQIGCVTLPVEILDKIKNGDKLNRPEEIQFNSHPELGSQLVKNIPRLENIAKFIQFQLLNFDGSNGKEDTIKGEQIPLVSRILKVANDYDILIQSGMSPLQSIKTLQENSHLYDILVLNELEDIVLGNKKEGYIVRIVNFKELRIGMILSEPLTDEKSNVLIKKGDEITDVNLLSLINISKTRKINEPIKVIEYVY